SAGLEERLGHLAAWISPFFLLQGLWVSALAMRHMLKERRASTGDLAALVSLIVLAAILGTPEKDILPGAWYVLMLTVLWAPLVTRRLAKKESFYSRGFRLTFLAGFLVCGGMLYGLQGDSKGLLLPAAGTLLKVIAGV